MSLPRLLFFYILTLKKTLKAFVATCAPYNDSTDSDSTCSEAEIFV